MRQKQTAFTLVEILVVTAIISLLLAILVPALGRARGQAGVVACRARLRELCLASLMYAQEYENRCPVDPAMLGPSHINSRARNGGWIANPHLALMALLHGYVGSDEVFYCPAWKDARFRYDNENVVAGEIGYFYFSVEQAIFPPFSMIRVPAIPWNIPVTCEPPCPAPPGWPVICGSAVGPRACPWPIIGMARASTTSPWTGP